VINPSEFNRFSPLKQTQVLFEKGRELMTRREGEYTIRLYRLSEFFVEIWYLPRINKVLRVEVVNIEEIMHQYEPEIDINDLFN
jgi:hypothetical protein